MFVKRLRRYRVQASIRNLLCEHALPLTKLIQPLFIKEGETLPMPNLPGMNRYALEDLLRIIEDGLYKGVASYALFPVVSPEKKDLWGSEALNGENFLNRAVEKIKATFPETCIMTDVALDPYTSHGHDGIWDECLQDVDNDATVSRLATMALLQAQAGSDMVCPSDMMDGRVKVIRGALDEAGFNYTLIHAYAAKFASCYYGPFRDCLGSGLKSGTKRTYQLAPTNDREALLEALTDEQEGADILMVKPAGPYLDILAKLRQRTLLPLSAYQVSGEYAQIKAAATRGWIDEKAAFQESLTGIKRAGADMIITYAALEYADWMKKNQ